jgi:hypothetical protein
MASPQGGVCTNHNKKLRVGCHPKVPGGLLLDDYAESYVIDFLV